MSLETFDFNIIALIIAVFCVIFGSYYGVKREAKKSINFFVPLLITHIFIKNVILFVEGNEFANKIVTNISKFLEYFLIKGYNELYYSLIVIVIFYIILYLLVMIIIGFFKAKPEKEILNKVKKISRMWGAILALIKGYFITILVYFLCNVLFIVDHSSGYSEFVVNTSYKFSYLTEYAEVKRVSEEYFHLDEEVSIITGEYAIKFVEELSENESPLKKSFLSSLEKPLEEYGHIEVISRYNEYIEENGTERDNNTYEIICLRKFLNYISDLMRAYDLNLASDLSKYNEKITNDLYYNFEELVERTSKIIKKVDFQRINLMFKHFQENQSLYKESEYIAYQYIINENKSIIKINKNNIFVSSYLNDCIKNEELEGYKFANYFISK